MLCMLKRVPFMPPFSAAATCIDDSFNVRASCSQALELSYTGDLPHLAVGTRVCSSSPSAGQQPVLQKALMQHGCRGLLCTCSLPRN